MSDEVATEETEDQYLLTTPDCPFCRVRRKELKEDIDSGKIKVVELKEDTPEMDAAIESGIISFPTLIGSKKVDDNKRKVCVFDPDTKERIQCLDVNTEESDIIEVLEKASKDGEYFDKVVRKNLEMEE